MQNYCKTIGALAAASALVAGNASAGTPAPTTAPASAPESAISYELHTGYSSMYLWRGLDLGDDLIEVGADVAGEWNGIGLSAGAWYGSFDAGTEVLRQDVQVDTDELDLYGEVSKDFGFLTASVGYIYYYYPQAHGNKEFANLDNSQEVYFGVSRDLGFAAVSLNYFWDIQGGDNEGYSELALTRSFELNSCLSLNVGTNVGYLAEGGDFTAWTSKVALDWAFVENAKLSPFVAVSVALGESENSYWAETDNEFVAGSMLSVSF